MCRRFSRSGGRLKGKPEGERGGDKLPAPPLGLYTVGVKAYTREQILEAIDHSSLSMQSVADYLSMAYPKQGGCSDDTARRYIERYQLMPWFRARLDKVSAAALGTVRAAIEDGDVKASQWWLERIKREQFGAEVTLKGKDSDPLNVVFSGGGGMSAEELRSAEGVEVADAKGAPDGDEGEDTPTA